MGQVTLTINNRTYKVACDDGQEDRIVYLSKLLNEKVMHLVKGLGQTTDSHFLLMAGLLIADELQESRENAVRLERQVAEMRAQTSGAAGASDGSAELASLESEMADLIDETAASLEEIAAALSAS
ncbi:MAG: cell division protein ZapA [Pseudomonadota bacterium]